MSACGSACPRSGYSWASINEAAAERAQAGGMTVVMDRCIYVDRARMPV